MVFRRRRHAFRHGVRRAIIGDVSGCHQHVIMTNIESTREPAVDGALVCARCGAPFRCGSLAGDAACWCAALPALPLDRLRPGEPCLCRACLLALIEKTRAADSD
ncbi:cysteine-rich CWC family protein [Caballeronia grimmiae]|uniref:cysteine-rich CWC family protein n=2 Tax=Caballeronia TaxID=1827195 RepID=UPI0031401F9A